MQIPINSIKLENNRRKLDEVKIQELCESISQIGLLHPITVTSNHILVAGGHRLEAAKLLGWDDIKANVLELDGLSAELAMLDENLIRAELHYIERGEQWARRKALYEELYPETKSTQNGGAFRGNQYQVVTADSAPTTLPFTADTTSKTGVSQRVIHEELQIANNLTPTAKEVVINSDIPKRDALKLARMESEEQDAVVAKIVSGSANSVTEALSKDDDSKEEDSDEYIDFEGDDSETITHENEVFKPYEIPNVLIPTTPEPLPPHELESSPNPSKPFVAHNSGNNEWYTPREYIEAARGVLGVIDLDPASCEVANRVVQAERYFTAEDNGLEKEWRGNIWMNPPYAGELIPKFCDKLRLHVESGDVTQAISLTNNATETAWFNTLVGISSAILFPKSRVKFYMPDGKTGTPLQGQCIFYIGDNPKSFMEAFEPFGWGAYLC